MIELALEDRKSHRQVLLLICGRSFSGRAPHRDRVHRSGLMSASFDAVARGGILTEQAARLQAWWLAAKIIVEKAQPLCTRGESPDTAIKMNQIQHPAA
jgi:hypothetical protein